MPTVTLNKQVVEKSVGKKLPLEILKDRISMLGTALEHIEQDDIVVEVFPNRPDMLSEQGFARALSSFVGVKTGLRKYDVKKSNYKVVVEKAVRGYRPKTSVAVVKDLQLNEEKIGEIMQIQEKLHTTYCRNRKKAAIGFYVLDQLAFPLRYSALPPEKIKFTPLGFEKEMSAVQIIQQHPTCQKYTYLIEKKDKIPVWMDAHKNVMSIPPLINSNNTGKLVSGVNDVFIECSGYDQRVLDKLMNILVTTLADMGGTIYSLELSYEDGEKLVSPNLMLEKMKVDLNYINKRLGLDLKENEIKKCLEQMGYGYEKGFAVIPAYRADILHQADLMEDIAIAYGYEKFQEEIPNVATTARESPFEKFKEKIAQLLVGLHMNEVNTFHLSNRETQEKKMQHSLQIVELANALTEDYNVMRAWLIPHLLEVLKNNKHHEYPQNIFMLGTVFKQNPKTETGVQEDTRLCVMHTHEHVNFTELKQIIDYLMRMLHITYEIKEVEHSSFIPGRVARISCKNIDIAYVGELTPTVIKNFELDMPVACFELNCSELFKLALL